MVYCGYVHRDDPNRAANLARQYEQKMKGFGGVGDNTAAFWASKRKG